jgi:hypothetical protein
MRVLNNNTPQQKGFKMNNSFDNISCEEVYTEDWDGMLEFQMLCEEQDEADRIYEANRAFDLAATQALELV